MRRLSKIAMVVALMLPLVLGVSFACLPLPGTVSVLMYHFIGNKDVASEHKNFVSIKSFAWQMAFLKFFQYRVISLDDLYRIKTGSLKPRGREVAITFDDGNFTFTSFAMPILERYGFPVAVFAVSESVKRGGLNGSIDTAMLKEISQKEWVTVGSHSQTHPLLSRMTEEGVEREVSDSKRDLEEILKRPVYYFAYPSSDVNEKVVEITKNAGYRLAFVTSPKKLGRLEEGLHSLTRVKISQTSDIPFVFWSKVSGIYPFFKKQRERLCNFDIKAGMKALFN